MHEFPSSIQNFFLLYLYAVLRKNMRAALKSLQTSSVFLNTNYENLHDLLSREFPV